MSNGRLRSGLISNALPIGPMILIVSPTLRSASKAVPSPSFLYKKSTQPNSLLTRIIEIGRRIGRNGCTVKCAKLPGCAFAAIFGACTRMIY